MAKKTDRQQERLARELRALSAMVPSAEEKIDMAVVTEDLDALEEGVIEMALDFLEKHDDDVDRTAEAVIDALEFRVDPNALAEMGLTHEDICQLVALAYEMAMELDRQLAGRSGEARPTRGTVK